MVDRVELRWGPAVVNLDLAVLNSDGCITSAYRGNCPDSSLNMNMTTPGPEIITWRSNSSRKYLIGAYAYAYALIDFPIDSEVSS